jgi:RNA polymerase sigma factor (sigma-70 family)
VDEVKEPELEDTTEHVDAIMRALAADRSSYLAFVRVRTRSNADAEDILQQGLLKAAEHAGDLRDPERLRAWFFQILRRCLADHRARGQVKDAKLALLAADTVESTTTEPAICRCGLGQLARLRPEQADIVRRVDLEDEPLPVAAAAIGITTNNATVRLHRARKTLRDRLQEVCGSVSMRACLDCDCE